MLASIFCAGVTAIAWLAMLLNGWLKGHSNMPIHVSHIRQHHGCQGSTEESQDVLQSMGTAQADSAPLAQKLLQLRLL